MSFAVLHIMKASGSYNAIARHIERCTQPDNAHPELRHLNRDDFIRYPDGVSGLGEAIQYRLDHAGLTRKIGRIQVLALNVLLTSDGDRKLEVDNRFLEGKHELYQRTNDRLQTECETLTRTNRELVVTNNNLVPEVTSLVEAYDRLVSANSKLSAEVDSLELRKMRSAVDADFAKYKAEIERYCPDVPDLVVWGRYCTYIGFPDHMTHRILAQQTVAFSGSLYSPEHNQKFSTDHSEAKLERNPENTHRFNLKIDGISVFQWFREMARKLLEKMGFRQPEPRQKSGAKELLQGCAALGGSKL